MTEQYIDSIRKSTIHERRKKDKQETEIIKLIQKME